MGNGHDDHHSIHQKGIYLPMFCRLSIKDVKQSHRHEEPIPAGDPSSPKVSCMGQVKRTNRVVGFPNASSAAAAHLHKHRRPFPAKALLPNTAVIGGRSGSRSCRTSKEMCVNRSRASRVKTNCDHNGDQECVKVVDIGEMDPPLPVVKRAAAAAAGRDEVNLWKRRFSNGSEIKCLQIEQIKLQSIKFQPPPSTA